MNSQASTPQDLSILSKEQLIDELIKSRAEAMFYYDFVEASLNLIWQCDLEGRYVYLNSAWEQIFGYKVEEMLGRKFAEFQHPEMAARDEQEFARLIRGGVVKDFETVHIGKAGNDIHLVFYAKFMTDESGNITGVQGTAYDITGRKKAEEEARSSEAALKRQNSLFLSLLKNLPIGIFMVEVPSGKPLVANEEALRLLGRGILPDVSLSNISEVYKAYKAGSNELYPSQEMPVIRAMHGETSSVSDMVVERPDGTRTFLEVFGSPVTDDQGRIWASLVSFQDISERKKTEAELEAYRRHLEVLVDHRTAELGNVNSFLILEKKAMEMANRDLKQMQAYMIQTEKMASLGRLAAGIAHEINNPIGYIGTNLSVLRKYADTIEDMLSLYDQLAADVKACSMAEVSQPLSLVEDFKQESGLTGTLLDFRKLIDESICGTMLIAKIVGDLRTFARVERAVQESADIHALIDSTLTIARSNLKYSVEIVKEYGDLPQILCYPRQMEQVFVNLLLNAAQAVGEKGKVIIRTLRQQEEVLIEIEDNGYGIREHDLQRIFEPFFTTKEIGQGIGLGLAIVYNIIEKHEGRIMVRSTVGKGTVVTINLPIGGKSQ